MIGLIDDSYWVPVNTRHRKGPKFRLVANGNPAFRMTLVTSNEYYSIVIFVYFKLNRSPRVCSTSKFKCLSRP